MLDAERRARVAALRAALVVAARGVAVLRARVERHEPPVAELERHGSQLERGEVDPQRRARAAVQRRELVEQARLRPDPVVLDARAEPGQLGAVGLVRAGDGEQRQAERGLERRRGGQAGALRDVARERQPRAADLDARRAQLRHRPAHERPPAVRAAGRGGVEAVGLAEVARLRADLAAGERLGFDRDATVDRERQREAAVVVGVLADQVDAAGAERADHARRTTPAAQDTSLDGMTEQPPTSRLSRSARLGGLVAGQSARWVGTRAANVMRSPERADEATGERAAALARELVEQLGQMRGAAMKVGQVLSTIDFTALPEGEREDFKQTLAKLRDDVPPLPYKQVEKLLREDLGEKPATVFSEFEEEAFAAASIGQVHRAVTREGRAVAVKVQYPGVAEAVDTDLRNLTLLLPLVKRLAPGLDVKAVYAELRERIAEELDYELEAQNHRAVARAHRGHPFAHVPEVHTELSSRRVLVTDLITGARFGEVKTLDDETRDRFGEIVFRFYFGLVHHTGRVAGDPHPGNYLLLDDGRVGFFDFGLMRVLDRAYLDREASVAVAIDAGDAQGVHAALSELGYLPEPATFEPEALMAQIAAMGAWYLEPGPRRLSPAYVAELIDSTSGPRSPWFAQMRRQTLPPQALLLRRMEGLVLSTLGEVRAGADWHAIAREYYARAAPSTPLGEAEAEFWPEVQAAA